MTNVLPDTTDFIESYNTDKLPEIDAKTQTTLGSPDAWFAPLKSGDVLTCTVLTTDYGPDDIPRRETEYLLFTDLSSGENGDIHAFDLRSHEHIARRTTEVEKQLHIYDAQLHRNPFNLV